MTKQIKDIIDVLEPLIAYMHDGELPSVFDEEDERNLYLAIKLLRDSVPLSVIEDIKAEIETLNISSMGKLKIGEIIDRKVNEVTDESNT